MKETGYFARASEDGHKAMSTKHVHFVEDRKPICRYKPHETMRFQFCSVGFYDGYASCPECIAKKKKMAEESGL